MTNIENNQIEIFKLNSIQDNNYDYVTKIFGNWCIVTQEKDQCLYFGIVDTDNKIILPIEKGYIFISEDMIFVDREKSFVLDCNGNYIANPQENVWYEPSCGLSWTRGQKPQHNFSGKIIVYEFKDEDYSKLHLFVPGQQPSKGTPDFRGIERLNDSLYKIFDGRISDWHNKLFGIINKYGNIVLPTDYEIITKQNNVFYLVQDICDYGDGKYVTAIDRNGHVLVDSDDTYYISPKVDNYVLISKLEGRGLLYPEFNIIIPPQHPSLEFVEHNVLRHDRSYYIDYIENPLIPQGDGYITLPAEFCWAREVADNLFSVCQKSDEEDWRLNRPLLGLIDNSQNVIMPFEYDYLQRIDWFGKTLIRFSKKGKEGIADLGGNIMLSSKYDRIDSGYQSEYCFFPLATMWNEDKDGCRLYGVLSPDFEEILPPIHQVLRLPKEDMIVFMFSNIWGFYSMKEQTTRILHGYSMVKDFSEGYSSVNIGGEMMWVEVYDELGYSQKQLRVNKGKWGVICKTGQLIIPCIYDAIGPFTNGGAVVKKEGKRGMINAKGEVIVPIIYDYVKPIMNGVSLVRNNELYGFVTTDGVAVECKYSEIMDFGKDDQTLIREDGTWGIIDKKGQVIIEANYDHIEYTLDGNYCCYLCEYFPEYDIIDKHGNIISSIRIEVEQDEEYHDWDLLNGLPGCPDELP